MTNSSSKSNVPRNKGLENLNTSTVNSVVDEIITTKILFSTMLIFDPSSLLFEAFN